eukprot:TRINITY_DN9908_c0_g1_i1.p1 TRINITY_DN9908_c0_g1~~TRINITY_DN9908_c0_g1_i1.p1  ORF type:complete len:291 (-),score=49.27 TRINITY_DN9908_c0_g1_i1:35-907(-)
MALGKKFYTNPQYLIVSKQQQQKVVVEIVSKEESEIGVTVIKDPREIRQMSMEVLKQAMGNEKYRQAVNALEVELDQGVLYSLVPSTLKSNQFAGYKIKIHSEFPVEIQEVKHMEFAGNKSFKGEWTVETENIQLPILQIPYKSLAWVRFKLDAPQLISFHLVGNRETALAMQCFEIKKSFIFNLIASTDLFSTLSMGCFLQLELQPNENGYLIVFFNNSNNKGAFIYSFALDNLEALQLFDNFIDENNCNSEKKIKQENCQSSMKITHRKYKKATINQLQLLKGMQSNQ